MPDPRDDSWFSSIFTVGSLVYHPVPQLPLARDPMVPRYGLHTIVLDTQAAFCSRDTPISCCFNGFKTSLCILSLQGSLFMLGSKKTLGLLSFSLQTLPRWPHQSPWLKNHVYTPNPAFTPLHFWGSDLCTQLSTKHLSSPTCVPNTSDIMLQSNLSSSLLDPLLVPLPISATP